MTKAACTFPTILCWVLSAFLSAPYAQFPETVHPGYSLVNVRPDSFEEGIGGMDFLPDGSLAICTWGGFKEIAGKVMVLSNLAAGPQGTKIRVLASGLDEPMGLKVQGNDIVFMQGSELSKIRIPGGDSMAQVVTLVNGWLMPVGKSEDWTYGPLFKDGDFYGTQGSWNNIGSTGGPIRGSWFKMTPGKGYEPLAGGLRSPNGIGFGPNGDMFATDNQGNWLPACKLIHLVKGRFYGHLNNYVSPFVKVPESPPAVWVPYGTVGFSPSEPILVPSGVYQGQMLTGDVHFGGVQRYFLEKINTPSGQAEYQGAVFRFTGGLDCGVNRLLYDKAGALYMGGVGGGGNWNWADKKFGIQKLVPNGKIPFDLLAVRSVTDGFELEFTKTAINAGVATKYSLKHWRYLPTGDYGGSELDKAQLTLVSATPSSDGKRVRLKVDGLKAGYVVHVKITGLQSETSEDLWSNQAWYTLNNLGPMNPVATGNSNPKSIASQTNRFDNVRVVSGESSSLAFRIQSPGPFELQIQTLQGHGIGQLHGRISGVFSWTGTTLTPGIYAYTLKSDGQAIQAGHFTTFHYPVGSK
ncbi:MAG: hypothetical protein M3Y08_19870 [Fibrobacterota bacterium]|nr:hypothetical protein [Fibrobacterota bacterium]